MLRRLFILASCAFAFCASAATLTTAQLQTLKAAINADAALVAFVAEGNLQAVADAMNAPASPSFTVWRSAVTSGETGDAWLGTDIAGMSSLNMQRLQLMLASSPSGLYDMRRSDRRAGFEDPFGTNVNNGSRVAMRTAWKRLATRGERLYATGTGSDSSPGLTTVEGEITVVNVRDALAS
jgi:hypothetical protein